MKEPADLANSTCAALVLKGPAAKAAWAYVCYMLACWHTLPTVLPLPLSIVLCLCRPSGGRGDDPAALRHRLDKAERAMEKERRAMQVSSS